VADTHLVTGATGFVGGALALELISRTDVVIGCLVRGEAPEARLERALTGAARAYGRADLIPEIRRRCRVIPGDILQPLCGEAAMRLENGTEIWHCAASLRFRQVQAPEIFAHNVGGTRNVVGLARYLRSAAVNYISTAYVAGTRTGIIREEVPPSNVAPNNCYERSKIEAESVLSQVTAVHTRILRPGIVIGHSRTHAATNFTGLYGCINELQRLKRRLGKEWRRHSLCNSSIRILGRPETPLNLIPVDAVAADAVRVGLSNSSVRVFHLTNSCQPEVASVAAVLMNEVGLPSACFVDSSRDFTAVEKALARALLFYGSYLNSPKSFDRTNTDACGGNSRWPLDTEAIRAYVRWFLETTVSSLRMDLRAA